MTTRLARGTVVRVRFDRTEGREHERRVWRAGRPATVERQRGPG